MPTTQKTVNYDDATVAKMTAIYQAAGTEMSADGEHARENAMAEIQKFTGKSIPSIRSKLGSLGVYVAKSKPEKKGGERVTKADLISKIAANGGKVDGFFDSLEGANKAVLQYVIDLQGADESEADFDADSQSD